MVNPYISPISRGYLWVSYPQESLENTKYHGSTRTLGVHPIVPWQMVGLKRESAHSGLGILLICSKLQGGAQKTIFMEWNGAPISRVISPQLPMYFRPFIGGPITPCFSRSAKTAHLVTWIPGLFVGFTPKLNHPYKWSCNPTYNW